MEDLPLGPFSVSSLDGALALRPVPPVRAQLRFAWRGRRCAADLQPDGLHLAAIAARIPSTADPRGDRARAFAALRDLTGDLPRGWRMALTPDHRIRLEAPSLDEHPSSPVRLVATLVRFVLELDPWLDRLEAAGTELPAAA